MAQNTYPCQVSFHQYERTTGTARRLRFNSKTLQACSGLLPFFVCTVIGVAIVVVYVCVCVCVRCVHCVQTGLSLKLEFLDINTSLYLTQGSVARTWSD
jgi:hypothetical protein